MGSEKFPKENEFDQYIASHGGFDNAYTESEYTLFHFDIIEKHLAGALDRFSQFFISPLMSQNSMEREMLAVESEFQSNSIDDEVRISQIFCTMIHDTHPASNFIWGNLKTLRDGVRRNKLHEKLHEFRLKNYTANRMFLCIQSSVDMPRLERTVVKYFTDIRRGVESLQPNRQSAFEMFKPNFFEKIFFVKPTAEKCKLLMTYLLPTENLKYLEYLASLFEYEGCGSLSDFFMDEFLATKVKAKVGRQSFEGNLMFTLFTVEVNLTSRGYQNFDNVLEAIFAFLLLLKTTKIEEHKRRFEEFREIKEILFKYRRESSAIENVQELAVNMRYFKDEDVIVGNEIFEDFDGEKLKNLIEICNTRKFNLMVICDKYQKFDKVEKWFGTEYAEVGENLLDLF
jgi:nardilysin